MLMDIVSGSSYLNPPTTLSVERELDGVRMENMKRFDKVPDLFVMF